MNLELTNKYVQSSMDELTTLKEHLLNYDELNQQQELVSKLEQAISLVSDIQKNIFQLDPSLYFLANGFNIDERYVKSFRHYMQNAKSYEQQGKIKMAHTELRKAMETELPAQMHEIIVQELERLSKL